MKFRKLRIAWTAICGIACLLLIVLWVRSYWRLDMLQVTLVSGNKAILMSCQGAMRLSCRSAILVSGSQPMWNLTSHPTTEVIIAKPDSVFGFQAKRTAGGYSMTAPHWFPILLAAPLAIAPWIRQRARRFSLRTLLVATTLVAVVLGLVVALLR